MLVKGTQLFRGTFFSSSCLYFAWKMEFWYHTYFEFEGKSYPIFHFVFEKVKLMVGSSSLTV